MIAISLNAIALIFSVALHTLNWVTLSYNNLMPSSFRKAGPVELK